MSKDQKGMRFWLPGVFNGAPPEHKYSEIPFPDPAKGGEPGRYNAPNIKYRDKPFAFVGEIYVDDPSVCKALMESRDHLRFDPQEAVDKGMLSHADVTALGFLVAAKEVKADAEPEPEPKTPPAPARPLPDFSVMSKRDLSEYAVDKEIVMSGRLNHNEMVAHLREAMSEKEQA